jgi:glycosyltransferase involved in cell wall biosynthesis/MoaA/NifB/PqqE/SkfB family radical SAM enzyme
LIRLAVHSSFFNLFKYGKYPDLQSFYQAYLDRVKRFFHCHTAEPDVAVEIAKRACEQIISSGLFNSKRLTLLELHLTNRCNLDCSWCTYKTKDAKQSIIFEDLTRIRDFSPIEILIAGGGEPTLFQNEEYDFNDAIACLREKLPGTRLRLITNGTMIPKGDWLSKVDEISISLDDVCPESYLLHKGQDLFHIVWQNIQAYLFESPVSTIRVTKIYNRQNVSEGITLAENLFLLWSKLKPKSIKRCYFRFMLFPMADDQNQCDPYASSKLTAAQKENWLDTVSEIRKAKPDFYSFLENNTNVINLAETEQEAPAAEKCWPVAHYMLIGADRKIYPCFAMCSNFCMTSIGDISLTLDELLQRRENLFSYPPLQCRSGCRPGSVFYGQRSKEYYLDQGCLKLPTIQYKKNERPYIIHVSYHDPNHLMGGQGWAVYNLCREQTKRGEFVYWFSPCVKQEHPGEYLYENGQLRVIKIKFTDEAVDTLFADDEKAQNLREKFGRSVIEKIKMFFNPADCIIHLHGFIEMPRLSSELRKEGYRVVSTFHMLLSKRNEQLQNNKGVIDYLRKLEKSAIDSNSVISVPSNGMAEELMEVSPDFKGSIYCVHNGVGEEHFTTPFPEEISSKPLVVSYGRISPEKGYDLFIEAAKLVIKNTNAQKQPLLRFLIFGNTDYTIEARRLYAENLMKSIHGHENIQALISAQGIVGPEKIALIDQAMFGVILSRYEPFGMVIPELMARGKPVITTLTPGSIDIMQSDRIGRNDFGFIIEPNARSITEAIEWMISHPSDLKMMSKNAVLRASQFRWKNTADEYYHLYRQL